MDSVWHPAWLKARLHLFLVPLAALIATLPLILRGTFCGHDFDFHLLSWFEAATQFAHGNLHPHWAFTPAFNAGEPRFVFYPPISWYLGAFLGLLLTHLPGISEAAAWTATPILFTWVALTLSGLTMHRLAGEFASPSAATLAATFYLASPYMLFTAYERTAYAELLAAAWIPLLYLAILEEKPTIPRIALPLALLWLTNAPAAVMGAYTLALLATLRLIRVAGNAGAGAGAPGLDSETWETRHRSTLRLALTVLAGTLLAFALVAFYLLPAAYERRYVQISMATIAGMKISANFLFEHTGTSSDNLIHDQVLHTVSLVAVILLLAAAIALAINHLRRTRGAQFRFPVASLTILTAAIAFLLTPLSLPIWDHTPQLTFLQFPWRFLAILAPILALATASVLGAPPQTASLSEVGSKQPALQIATALTLAAALTLPAYHFFRQPCDPPDTAPARIALFHSNTGTDATDEYTPNDADNEALAPPGATDPDAVNPSNYPPYWLADTPEARPPSAATPGPAPPHLSLNLPRPEDLVLNLRDYPAWRVIRNDSQSPPHLRRPDGLVVIPLPAGPSTLDVRYTLAPDQALGDAITFLALPIFLFTLLRYGRVKAQSA